MNTLTHSKKEKAVRELVIGKCWDFFNENFHKFNQSNKIRIALALCSRDIPTTPLVDNSRHLYFNNSDEKLLEEFQKRNLPIPEAIKQRLNASTPK